MKEYTKSGRIHPCKLERNDLLQLIKIVKETFPVSDRKDDFNVSTNLPNISIRENSIEDFLKHEELPDKFNRLSIRARGWSENREIDKDVRMTFYDNFIDLDVDGTDQTWVLGKYSQITNLLREKRPWFWVFKAHPVLEGFIQGFILLLSFKVLDYFIKANEMIYSISAGMFFIAWICVIVFSFRQKSRFKLDF